MFFKGFIVKISIASHPVSKEFILSQSLEKFLFSFTKSLKLLFLSMYIFWRFYQNYYFLYMPSEQFHRFSLKLHNMSLSPRDKYQKILIFFWELQRDKRRQEQRDRQMFQFTLGVISLNPSLSLISNLLLPLHISSYLQVRTDLKNVNENWQNPYLKVHWCRFENLSICLCSYKNTLLKVTHSES